MKNLETKLLLAFGIVMILITSINIIKNHLTPAERKSESELIKTLTKIESTQQDSAREMEMERQSVIMEIQNHKIMDSLTKARPHVVAVMGDGDVQLVRLAIMPWSTGDEVLMNPSK